MTGRVALCAWLAVARSGCAAANDGLLALQRRATSRHFVDAVAAGLDAAGALVVGSVDADAAFFFFAFAAAS